MNIEKAKNFMIHNARPLELSLPIINNSKRQEIGGDQGLFWINYYSGIIHG